MWTCTNGRGHRKSLASPKKRSMVQMMRKGTSTLIITHSLALYARAEWLSLAQCCRAFFRGSCFWFPKRANTLSNEDAWKTKGETKKSAQLLTKARLTPTASLPLAIVIGLSFPSLRVSGLLFFCFLLKDDIIRPNPPLDQHVFYCVNS